MEEIRCPKCGAVFQVDESDYIEILKQVRDKAFNEEITERERRFEKDRETALALLKSHMEKEFQAKVYHWNYIAMDCIKHIMRLVTQMGKQTLRLMLQKTYIWD